MTTIENDETAGVAQSVEQLVCNQPVGGSNPPAGSMEGKRND